MTTASEPLPTPAGRLLILDDDDLVGILIETVGRLAGMQTHRSTHADDFFAACDEREATQIVLDMTMPEMTGEDVLRALAVRGCRARIILSSGDASDRLTAAATLARTLGLEVAGILPKPFAPAALRRLLGAA